MKKSFGYSLAIVALVGGLIACNKTGASKGKAVLKTELDSASYALGWSTGGMIFRQSGIEKMDPKELIKEEAFLKGLYDCITKDSGFALDAKEMDKVAGLYLEKLRTKVGKDYAAKTTKIFEENGKRKGVITLKNGVQYEIIKAGTGVAPTLSDSVTFHVIMKDHLMKMLQNSYDRGAPFTVGEVGKIPIVGLKDVLQLVPAGSKVKMWLPAAYSSIPLDERMSSHPVFSNSYQYYEVELLNIN